MNLKKKKIHFIGVSGIGVSAVAFLSIKRGYSISGSAIEKNQLVESLEKMGMKFYLGHRTTNINDANLVVRSAAIGDDNPEVREAFRRKIEVIFYSKYLGMLMSDKIGIAVAGTHGKTTTTAMIATILKHSRLEPEVVCGGIMREFKSNAIYGKGQYFVAEACEYNRSFLDLKKQYGNITNIEADHLDYYGNFENLLAAFREFISKTEKPSVFIVNGDNNSILRLMDNLDIESIRVGYDRNNDIRITKVKEIGGKFKYYLELNRRHMEEWANDYLTFELSVPGKFNIINSALASILALKLGIDYKKIEDSVRNFKGTERRLEKIGIFRNNPVISDYAHHPTEISVTMDAIRKEYAGKKLLVIFQPHQYSRTIFLFNQFVEALKMADYLIITEIYKQRDSEEYLKSVKSSDLYNRIRELKGENVFFISNPEDIWNFIIDFVRSNDWVIVFMGAGNIDNYARTFLN